MKVFISWSGEQSHHVAKALRDWMPQVLQTLQPWLASSELKPGDSISADIESNLEGAPVVLLCLTRQNMGSDWMKFEAGRAVEKGGRIVPVCFDFPLSELGGVLGQYQSFTLDQRGPRQLMSALNKDSDSPLDPSLLNQLLDIWIPKLADELGKVPSSSIPAAGPRRTIDELMKEILTEVHSLSARLSESQTGAINEVPAPEPPKESENGRPSIFIGSSVEGLPIAEHIQAGLEYVAECTVWNQGLFRPSETAIESLIEGSAAFDCAVIVLTADDIITQRENTAAVPRDNLIFELGLFTGFLGRAKTFMVTCRDDAIHLPTDLNGVTALEYPRRSDGNIGAAVAPACLRIKEVMGLR